MKRQEKVNYFGAIEEEAVIKYNNSDSAEEKNRLYNEILAEPFKKMVQSILRKYSIHIGNYTIEEIEENVLTHLLEHMIKFNPDKITKSGKKTKAFSYCQTIVRNYYKDHSINSYTEKKTKLCFDDFSDDIENNTDYQYEHNENEHNSLDYLISNVIEDIEEKIDIDQNIKKNEIIVGDAIVNILKNWDILFMEETPNGKYDKKVTNKFAKNKILFYLKEQTNLSTKEIRAAIKPFKDIYFNEKNSLLNDD